MGYGKGNPVQIDVSKVVNDHLTSIDTQLADIATLSSNYYQPADIDDTNAINRALSFITSNGGGKLYLPYKNTPYIISDTLIIGSNTELIIHPYVTIKLADNTNKVMIWNKNKSTDSDHTRLDANISIIGGIWDGNGANQPNKWYGTQNTTQLVTGFFFSGVAGLTLKPTKILNPKAYGALICNVSDLLVENFETDIDLQAGNEDGIHVLGPAENITIKNAKIRSQDNFIAINCNDVGHGPYATFGDIDGVTIEDIMVNNYDGGQGMLLLSGTFSLKNVYVNNIKGQAAYLSNIHTFDMGEGDYHNIIFENCSIDKQAIAEYPFVNMFGKMGKVKFRNIEMINGTKWTTTNRWQIHSTTKTPVTSIDDLEIDGLTVNGMNIPGADYMDILQIQTGVTINKLKVTNLTTTGNATPIIPLDISSCVINTMILKDFIMENCRYGSMYYYKATSKKIFIENLVNGTKTPNTIRIDLDTPTIDYISVRGCSNIFIREQTNVKTIDIIKNNKGSSIPTDTGYYFIGDIIYSKEPLTDGFVGWIVVNAGSPFNTVWQPNATYNINDIVRIGNFLCMCIVSGTTSATQPTVVEGDFIDGTLKWRYMYDGQANFKTFGTITV